MSPQLERLKKDSKELKHYMFRLQKSGNTTLAAKIKSKMEYVDSKVLELSDYEAHGAT